MIFGSLTEKEVQSISKLLDDAGVSYEVQKDESVLERNKRSLNNDLRYMRPPNLSTTILSIQINDFDSLSTETKDKLLEFGITNEIPEEFVGIDFGEIDHSDLAKSRKNNSFYGRWHLLGAALILLMCYLFITGKIQPSSLWFAR